MDLSAIQTYVDLLVGLGVNLDTVIAQLEKWAASHPGQKPEVLMVEGWLRDHIGTSVVDTIAKNAAPEIVRLVITGTSAVEKETSPTEFA